MPEVLTKIAVPFAFVDDLRVAGDQFHVRLRCGLLHGVDHDPQRFHLQPFFENEAGAQVERAGAAHGEIIHGTKDSKITNVAAGKNQRAHDERIRGESQARSVYREHRAIMPLLQHGIAERGHKNLFDELMGQASATAVRQDDAIVSDSRDWTVQVERWCFGVCHSDSRPRTRLRKIPWGRRAGFPAYTSRQTPGTRGVS